MENLRELQTQARDFERAGQHAAALELYGLILQEPAGDRDGSVWAHAGHMRLALGDDASAADSYATAIDRYAAAGLDNLALSFCQRLLRVDGSRSEILLRFGQLSAARGYTRDARHGYVEYADLAAGGGNTAGAVEALREYLLRYPADAAVRRRISELTGEEEPEPMTPPADVNRVAPTPLPGLIPTLQTDASPAGDDPSRSETSGVEADTAATHAPGFGALEGFEPTHADDRSAAVEGRRDGWHGAGEHAESGADDDEVGEPLPLLGMQAELQPTAWGDDQDADTDGAEELPLLGTDDAPRSSPAAPSHPADDPLSRARRRVADDPLNVHARREYAGLLQERGDPLLQSALGDAERDFADAERPAEALEFVEQLARLRPDDSTLQQRRVERALRAGNRPALVQAYLALAGRFEAELDGARAQEALRRVLELDPGNAEARTALASATAASTPPRDYVDLGELILAGVPEEVTRFQVAIGDPTGDEENDFAEILDLFRKKVSESLDPKDATSHYDLGLAFKDMGLYEDAIVHLQSALRGGANPLATLEVLGECFVLKGQVSLASRVFERATRLDGVADSDLVGVLYGLARSQETLGLLDEAAGNFERVVAVDLSFRDAAARLEALVSR